MRKMSGTEMGMKATSASIPSRQGSHRHLSYILPQGENQVYRSISADDSRRPEAGMTGEMNVIVGEREKPTIPTGIADNVVLVWSTAKCGNACFESAFIHRKRRFLKIGRRRLGDFIQSGFIQARMRVRD